MDSDRHQGLEDFLSRVNEVEGLVSDIASASDSDSVTIALNRADNYLTTSSSRGSTSSSSSINEERQSVSSDENVIGFNRTIINQTNASGSSSVDYTAAVEGGTDQVAFCKALEEDAKERAERREKRLAIGNKMKRDGNDFFRQERYTEALDHYSEAIQQLPGEVILYTNRALTYLKLDQYEEVLKDCDTALKFNELTLKAYLYKGKALISLGRDNEARDCFETALSLLPDKQTTIKGYIKNIDNWKL